MRMKLPSDPWAAEKWTLMGWAGQGYLQGGKSRRQNALPLLAVAGRRKLSISKSAEEQLCHLGFMYVL